MFVNRWSVVFTTVLVAFLPEFARGEETRGTIVVNVQDSSGAVVPGATVQIAGAGATSRTLKADGSGKVVTAMPAGLYSVRVGWRGFSEFAARVQLDREETATVEAILEVKPGSDSITVASEAGTGLSTDPSENSGAVVIRGEDLESLPDDPEDLTADLNALIGPGTASGMPEILVDGFSAGRVPPKSAIREIRINQNPFSAEYDKMGLGRAEILTKPGSDQFHGAAFFKFSDAALNSRNPYSTEKAPYQARQFGGEFGGPVGRTGSIFLEFERRDASDNVVVHATALDPQFNIVPIQETVLCPERSSSLSARIDRQLGTRNTLSGRFTWLSSDSDNAGVGGLVLPSRSYQISTGMYSAQSTLTSVLNSHTTNEVRFQYSRENSALAGASGTPSLQVLDAFSGGGPLDPTSSSRRDRVEFQNITSWSKGSHTVKFGGRLRELSLLDESRKDFNGLFVFSGRAPSDSYAPVSSIGQYQRTVFLLSRGVAPSDIRRLGGGASQFLMAAGQPRTALNTFDAGLFFQDDWRITQSFSLSAGLRWETQSSIGDRTDFAPRLGFAWAPGSPNNRKTVIRGGFGVFFQRVGEDVLLNAARFDGTSQALYIVRNPDFFPYVPDVSRLAAMALPPAVRRLQPGLQEPYLLQTSLSVERQLPLRLVFSTTYTRTRGLHLLMSRNTNAPLPGSQVRPFAGGDVFAYESSGVLNQNQLLTSVARRFGGRFSAFGYYAYGTAYSDTDGADTMPANQYNVRADYGRSAFDIRHRAVVGGSVLGPLGIRISPFLVAHSGAPFNITTGQDVNRDSVFNDRPSFAPNASAPGVVTTPFGAFDLNPGAGSRFIPHNYAQGPAFCTLNFRVSRTYGFGMRDGHRAAAGSKRDGVLPLGTDDSVLRSALKDGATEHRFNLTVALQVRNVLNHVNPGLPVGNLSSPMFGLSNWLASSAGGDSPAMGDNRRIQLQLRLTF